MPRSAPEVSSTVAVRTDRESLDCPAIGMEASPPGASGGTYPLNLPPHGGRQLALAGTLAQFGQHLPVRHGAGRLIGDLAP